MQETETIQVLGRGTNVDFTIDDNVPFEIAERSLREYLEVCRGLYSSGTVSVNVGRRILVPEQLTAIKEILDRETGLTVTRYWCAPEILQRALTALTSVRPELASPGLASTNSSYFGESDIGREDVPVVGDDDNSSSRQESSLPEDCQDREVDDRQMVLDLFEDGGSLLDGEEGTNPAAVLPRVNPAEGQETGVAAENESPDSEQGGDDFASPSADSPSRSGSEPGQEVETGDLSGLPSPGVEKSGEGYANHSDIGPALPGKEAAPWLRRGSEALIIKATCRSGEIIEYPGDVVVYGDVNPGAEIVAGGDIVVLGALRGLARAGADHNTKATIFALNLESHRMQIGSYVGEAPDDVKLARSDSRAVAPKIAYLRRGSVFVVPFTRRREDYQGGILYEG